MTFLSPSSLFSCVSAALLSALCFAGGSLAGQALGQEAGNEPTGAVVVELGGAAGDNLSFNYDLRYPGPFGFRLGMTLDPRELDRADGPDEDGRDPDEPYGLLGLGHFFVSEGPFALEVGAGPVFRVDEGDLSVRATGHVGVRVQPVFERFLVRVGDAPSYGPGGYEGFLGFGVGYQISF